MTRNVRTRNEHVAAAVKEAVVRVQALGLQPAVRLRHIMHFYEYKSKGNDAERHEFMSHHATHGQT